MTSKNSKEEKKLIRPQEIPLKYWNNLIEEIEKDLLHIKEHGASGFESASGFELEISPDVKEVFSKIYKILEVSRVSVGDHCPKCNSERIITGEGWAECVDCGWRDVESDSPTDSDYDFLKV